MNKLGNKKFNILIKIKFNVMQWYVERSMIYGIGNCNAITQRATYLTCHSVDFIYCNIYIRGGQFT